MKLELTLVSKFDNDKLQINKVEADDFVQLLAQFQFVILNVQRKIHAINVERSSMIDDDIPF